MESRIYGYARISSKDGQNELRQIVALKEAEVEERFLFFDRQSGKDFERPQWKILKAGLRSGDLLKILSLDRMGRDYTSIISEWRDITQTIGADIQILDMPLLDTTLHKDLLGNFISNLILEVLSFVAEQERQNIRSRQKAGIELCLADRNRHYGRKKILRPENFDEVYARVQAKEITAVQAMRELGLTKTIFYRFAKEA